MQFKKLFLLLVVGFNFNVIESSDTRNVSVENLFRDKEIIVKIENPFRNHPKDDLMSDGFQKFLLDVRNENESHCTWSLYGDNGKIYLTFLFLSSESDKFKIFRYTNEVTIKNDNFTGDVIEPSFSLLPSVSLLPGLGSMSFKYLLESVFDNKFGYDYLKHWDETDAGTIFFQRQQGAVIRFNETPKEMDFIKLCLQVFANLNKNDFKEQRNRLQKFYEKFLWFYDSSDSDNGMVEDFRPMNTYSFLPIDLRYLFYPTNDELKRCFYFKGITDVHDSLECIGLDGQLYQLEGQNIVEYVLSALNPTDEKVFWLHNDGESLKPYLIYFFRENVLPNELIKIIFGFVVSQWENKVEEQQTSCFDDSSEDELVSYLPEKCLIQ